MKLFLLTLTATFLIGVSPSYADDVPALKDVFKDDFLVGSALTPRQIRGEDKVVESLIAKQFSTYTAENSMKWSAIQPNEGQFNFTVVDDLVTLSRRNKAVLIGHTLVWQTSTPSWVFKDEQGKRASRQLVLKRLEQHINAVAGRYKDDVHGWDVVNEAFNDDGTWRDTEWYRILGEDYVLKAFEYAAKAAPYAELYYNDYHLFKPAKRKAIMALVNKLRAKGLRIDGVGIQGHYALGYPDLKKVDQAVVDLSAMGLDVMFTEVDVSVLPYPNKEQKKLHAAGDPEMTKKLDPYTEVMSPQAHKRLSDFYTALFDVFLRHRASITRVTFWSVNDGKSWRNNWPLKNRTDHPLLFDRGNQLKPAFFAVVEEASSVPKQN